LRPWFLVGPAVFLLAAGLRFYHLEWAEFKLDEARLAALALGLARDGRLSLWGIDSSIGIPNFPLTAWLAAIPFAISSDPLVATGFVAGLNTLAALGVYLLGRAWYGEAAGLVAGLLYASAPWAVLFSRKLWPPEFLAPLAVAFIFAADRGFAAASVRAQAAWLFLTGLLLAAMVQIQYAALSLLVSAGLWLLALRRRLRPAGLAGFAAGLGGAFLPFLLADPTRALTVGRGVLGLFGRQAQIDLKVLEFSWLLFTGQAIHSLAGPSRFEELVARVGDAGPAQVITGLWVGAGLLGQMAAIWRPGLARGDGAFRRRAVLLAGWPLGPILTQVRHPLEIRLEYLLCAMPAFYLLAGSAIAFAGRRWATVALILLALAVAGLQADRVRQVIHFVGTEATPGAYGVPLAAHRAVADSLRRLYAAFPAAEVWVVGPGANPAYDEYPAVYQVLVGRDIPIRFQDARRPADWPNYSVLILTLPGAGDTPEGAGPVGQPVPWRRGEGEARFRFRTGGAPAEPPSVLSPPPTWPDGVRLTGAAFPDCLRPGNGIRLFLYWDTGQVSTPFQVFNHLLAPDGSRVAQADGPGPPPVPGRTVISWFDLTVPADKSGTFRLVTGRYTLPGIRNLPRADTADPTVDLGELRVSPDCGQPGAVLR
jgi:hypothetical protein